MSVEYTLQTRSRDDMTGEVRCDGLTVQVKKLVVGGEESLVFTSFYMESANGSLWKLTVSNLGVLTTDPVIP